MSLADPWFSNLYLFRRAHDWRLLRAPQAGGAALEDARHAALKPAIATRAG
jgi:hypothetical protein